MITSFIYHSDPSATKSASDLTRAPCMACRDHEPPSLKRTAARGDCTQYVSGLGCRPMIASARTSRHRYSRRGLRVHEWPNGFRPVAILMIVLLLNSEFAFGSWL